MSVETDQVKVNVEDAFDTMIKTIVTSVAVSAEEAVPMLVLRIMQAIETKLEKEAGETKKRVAIAVLSHLPLEGPMKELVVTMVTSGIIESMIDGYIDVAKAKYTLTKHKVNDDVVHEAEQVTEKVAEQVIESSPKGCCTIM